MRFDVVVFDLDGTLIDSYRDIAGALNEVLGELGLPPRAPEEVKRMIGDGVATLLERGIGAEAPELLRRARARFKDAYAARLLDSTALFPGVGEALAGLRARGVRLAVATNKPRALTEPLVRGLGLERAGIGAWASADEVARRKPSPEVVRLALERLGATPSRWAYVGDMPVDVATARAAGATSVGVGWGFDPDGARAAGPDLWIEAPAHLHALATDEET